MHTVLKYVYRGHCLVDVSNAINNIPETCLTVCETMKDRVVNIDKVASGKKIELAFKKYFDVNILE